MEMTYVIIDCKNSKVLKISQLHVLLNCAKTKKDI